MTTVYILLALSSMLTVGLSHPLLNAENSTRCYSPQLPGGYLVVGKTVSVVGECMQVTCEADLTITGLTCPEYNLELGCHLTPVDYKQKYPDCCPQIFCSHQHYLRKRDVSQSTYNFHL